MKKKIVIYDKDGAKEQEVNYIPIRFIIAILLILLETVAVVTITILCAVYIPYFYLALYATQIFCVLKIINSQENPDYKIPWLLLVLVVPIAGFMIYFMFYDRKLSRKQVRRTEKIMSQQIHTKDEGTLENLEKEDRQRICRPIFCVSYHPHIFIKIQMRNIMIWVKSFLPVCWRI